MFYIIRPAAALPHYPVINFRVWPSKKTPEVNIIEGPYRTYNLEGFWDPIAGLIENKWRAESAHITLNTNATIVLFVYHYVHDAHIKGSGLFNTLYYIVNLHIYACV